MKPFVKEHAKDLEAGTQHFTEEQLLPAAQQLEEHLPEVTEEFTEETLKPAAKELSDQISQQVPIIIVSPTFCLLCSFSRGPFSHPIVW